MKEPAGVKVCRFRCLKGRHHMEKYRRRPDSFWPSLRDKIEHHLDERPEGCWVWMRARNPSGYGLVKWGGRLRLVHRAYLIELGLDVPKGMVIDHLCRNKSCANPDHLEVVTNRENVKRDIEWRATHQ